MAKKKLTFASVVKGKDGKADYIKISRDVVLKQGEFVNLDSKAQQLDSLKKANKDGKLSDEIYEKLKARAETIPEFVRFELSVFRET